MGVAGIIPLLAQRAVADSPRWTRAVGIIPPTPIKWLLAAALLDRLFEHPEIIEASVVYGRSIRSFVDKPSFSAAC